jgi:hypothetical protein
VVLIDKVMPSFKNLLREELRILNFDPIISQFLSALADLVSVQEYFSR